MKTKKILLSIKIISAMLFLCLGWSAVAYGAPTAKTDSTILYVKTGVTGDCSSWALACELQTALNSATTEDQVWVAAGIYKPTASSGRDISFALKSGVAVYGGFPADGGDWNSRNWKINLTTLSGDIGAPGEISDNSYNVATGDGVDAEAILDGFTISGGNANGDYPYGAGGGMYNTNASPTLKNITYSDNSAIYGGGIFNDNSGPTLKDVTFSDNSASFGGGMCNSSSSPTLTNVTFSNNSSDSYGGGMDNYDSNPALTNITFSGNSAITGGGMFNTEGSNPSLLNVTFSGNSAESGGGMYNWYSNPVLTNAILWGNIPNQIINGNNSTPVVTYSDIQGGYPGTGNIDFAPLLGALADNGGFTETHALLSGSPAIDTGNPDPLTCPATDQRGFLRPIDGNGDGQARCDMGAYEYGFNLSFNIYLLLILK